MKTYIICALLFCWCFPLKAQDPYPTKNEKLGFEAVFYHQPTAISIQEEDATRYCFVDSICDKDHPNKLYRITVWLFANHTNDKYTSRKMEEIIARKLHSSGLQLKYKSQMQRGTVSFTGYQLENKKEECTHFYIGPQGNKIYTVEIECKPDFCINYNCVEFLQQFNIITADTSVKNIAISELSYTIDFPYTPTIQKMEVPGEGIAYNTIASASSIQKQKAWNNSPDNNKPKFYIQEGEHPVDSYAITEVRFLKELFSSGASAEEQENIRKDIIRNLLHNADGELLKEENIQRENLKGTALTIIGGEDHRTFISHVFITSHTIYVIEVKLRPSDKSIHPEVIKFLESFRLK